MKSTDYAPRSAYFDTTINGYDLIGIEVGCDVGSHAEALMTYTNTKHLYLVDIWQKEFAEGYCKGRMAKFQHKVTFIAGTSKYAAKMFVGGFFDYVYIDITHDAVTVEQSLNDWWSKLKSGGVLGHRNYSTCKILIDKFIVDKKFAVDSYHNEIVIFK